MNEMDIELIKKLVFSVFPFVNIETRTFSKNQFTEVLATWYFKGVQYHYSTYVSTYCADYSKGEFENIVARRITYGIEKVCVDKELED